MLLTVLALCWTGTIDVDAIERDLARTWREGSPARSLRVRCLFELSVEQSNEALGDRYFPNTIFLDGKGRAARQWTGNQTKWWEDVAVRRARYRHLIEFVPPKGQEASRSPRTDRFFNGTNSWHHNLTQHEATQFLGSDRTTRLALGYYLDMIGFPCDPLGKERTTAGDSGEPYRLDALIPSGKYQLDGEEAVDGLACVILSRPGLDKLWLAKDHGWAIVRREWRWSVDGPLKRRIDNRDFREVAPGAWLPFKATMEIYGHPTTRPDRRVGVLRASVDHTEADIPDSWFEPDFPKGTPVTDVETGDRMPFGIELTSVDVAVSRSQRFGPAFHPQPWWTRPWAWGTGIAVLLGGTWGTRRWLAHQSK
jgi:hypothetical protein